MPKPGTNHFGRSDFREVTSWLQHYACFHCRKAFKVPFGARGPQRLCPQCRQPMTNMGTDFKAPPTDDLKQWQKVRLLAEAGVKFFPRWPTGTPGNRPWTLAEVPAFLETIHPPSEGERLLQGIRRAPTAPREGRLVQHGSFPKQRYSLLGRPLESGTALELFEAGEWKLVQFVSTGDGRAPIPQPYVRFACGNRWSNEVVSLTPQHRLRRPSQEK